VGLADALPRVVLGGDGELFLTDDANGQAIASVPAGATWIVVPDSAGAGVRLLKPDGSQLTSSFSSSSSFNLTQQTLPTTGTYTIVIDPSGTNTGSMNVSVTSP